jgi:hypothetical protein
MAYTYEVWQFARGSMQAGPAGSEPYYSSQRAAKAALKQAQGRLLDEGFHGRLVIMRYPAAAGAPKVPVDEVYL